MFGSPVSILPRVYYWQENAGNRELETVEMAPEGKALEQLKNNGYADKYRLYGEPISLIGVEFSRESRNIVGFECEAG